jgi:ATP-dependent DNA helicase RecG
VALASPDNATTAEAVARLRSALFRALAGGADPSKSPAALEDLGIVARAAEAGVLPDAQKAAAFCAAIREPGSLPGVHRNVVLARGGRLLLSLSMALEDAADEPPKRSERRRKTEAKPAPCTPFDPSLLELDGVGPKTASRLASRGLKAPIDLLYWLPRRYDDRRSTTPIRELAPGMRAVTRGTVARVRVFGPRWRQMMAIVLKDGDDEIAGTWFSNRRPRSDRFVEGEEVTLAGLVSLYKGKLQIAHPIVVTEENGDRVGRIVPLYAEVPGVAGRVVEKAIGAAALRAKELVADRIPPEITARRGLLPLDEALSLAHRPPAGASAEELASWLDGRSPAQLRLAYDEFFYLQLALALRRRAEVSSPAPPIPAAADLADEAGALLGFAPTSAQRRVVAEIAADLARGTPMRRLLQGDVGSGKTMVALAAILAATRAGCQAALMAPTEILAEQHMRNLEPALRRLGLRAQLHIGEARSSARKRSLAAIEAGTADLAIGTHALIQESVRFARLGLAVVDEQHRFGVSQRLGLVGKGRDGLAPHLLVMTATPIPRTLALTLHGDLDFSVLDELPPGRTPIETRLWSGADREEALGRARAALDRGEQVYAVCPIIEESEALDVSAAETVHAELCERFGPERVGLLHGRLEPERRDAVMDGFVRGEIAVLATTTVIEVGVDVPNATVMIVEGAQRFGLAQLHQLRGRVGRGARPSECHLIADAASADTAARLEVIAGTLDGFAIAEADLRLRGPGELYGRRQSGLPGFRFGDLRRDAELVNWARDDALALIAADPSLEAPEHLGLAEDLARRIEAGDGPVGEEAG